MRTLFEEKQRYDQWWLRAIVVFNALFVIAVVLHAMFTQLVWSEPWGDRPMSDTGLIVFSFLVTGAMFVMLYVFFNLELEVIVDRSSLSYRYYPILRSWRHIDKESIKSFETKTWIVKGRGHRTNIFGKRTIIVKGNTGISIDMMNGKKLVLGTQHPNEFMAALNKMKKGNEESVY